MGSATYVKRYIKFTAYVSALKIASFCYRQAETAKNSGRFVRLTPQDGDGSSVAHVRKPNERHSLGCESSPSVLRQVVLHSRLPQIPCRRIGFRRSDRPFCLGAVHRRQHGANALRVSLRWSPLHCFFYRSYSVNVLQST